MYCLSCNSKNIKHYAFAKDIEYFSTEKIFEYYQCELCKTLSINQIPSNMLSVIYPKNYYSFLPQRAGFLLKVKIFLDGLLFKKISKNFKKNKLSALDVGGGAGWMLDVLKKSDSRFHETQIVDIDESAKKIAEAKGHSYFCGKFENFYSEKKYDLILMLNLIEHVENPSEILEKCYECLETNGLILIKTPNIDSLDAKIFRHKNWGGFHCPRHWVLFSMDSFKLLAERTGFEILMFKYTQGSPFWAWSVFALIQKAGLVHADAKRPSYTHPLIPFLTIIFAGFDFLRMPFTKTSQMFFVLKKK